MFIMSIQVFNYLFFLCVWKVISLSNLLETGTKIFCMIQNMHQCQWKIKFCSTCLSEVRGFFWMRMKMSKASLLTVNYWISCKGKATNSIMILLHTVLLKPYSSGFHIHLPSVQRISHLTKITQQIGIIQNRDTPGSQLKCSTMF